MKRGADIIIETLAELGTKCIFTLSGNQIMPLFDAAIDSGIELIHVRHEAAAVHMADAWGRLTGQPGVAMVTAGPGFANCLSALYVAQMAESPIILLGGGAPFGQLGRGPFQEMEQATMARPVTKESYNLFNGTNLAAEVTHAWNLALAGRTGPIHISVPFDSLESMRDVGMTPSRDEFRPSTIAPNQSASILKSLSQASKPLVLAGPTFARGEAKKLLEDFQRLTRIPSIGMESPRGVNDPSLGAAAEVLGDSDCVLLLGKKLDFTLQQGGQPVFDSACQLMQIDPESSAIDLTRTVLSKPANLALGLVGDVQQAALTMRDSANEIQWPTSDWFDDVQSAIAFRPSEWDTIKTNANALHPVEVCREVQSYLSSPGSVFISDGGEFGQWAQACVTAEHRVINGPSGSIGSSIPFALAARKAFPGTRIVTMLGDGTFGFHPAEFDTAVRYELPFIAVVGNDAKWNAEHQIQLRNYGEDRTHECDLLPTRYDKVARAFGGHGELVSRLEDLAPALERAEQSGLPACVNVAIEGFAAPKIRRSP